VGRGVVRRAGVDVTGLDRDALQAALRVLDLEGGLEDADRELVDAIHRAAGDALRRPTSALHDALARARSRLDRWEDES